MWLVPTLTRLEAMEVGDSPYLRNNPDNKYVPASSRALWNDVGEQVDVWVVGSGGGGLAAAIAAADNRGDVLVIEKGSRSGGTTATSGGGLWIPNSPLAKAAGLEDSEQEAFDYIRCQSAAEVPDSLIWAYIRRVLEPTGKAIAAFMLSATQRLQ